MKDRGIIVTWETDGETFRGKISQQDYKDVLSLESVGKLTGKVIIRMEIPAAKDKQCDYRGGEKKILVRAEKLKVIGFYN